MHYLIGFLIVLGVVAGAYVWRDHRRVQKALQKEFPDL